MQLTGRTALVTGASRGIGRAIALALAAEGADVAINYVSSEGPRSCSSQDSDMTRNADVWATRREAEGIMEHGPLQSFARLFNEILGLIDESALELERNPAPFGPVCARLLIKGRNLCVGCYSLAHDGLAQESGALFRTLLEILPLIQYFRLDPNRVAAAVKTDKVPEPKKVAKANAAATGADDSALRRIRGYLSEHASHVSLSSRSMGHLVDLTGSLKPVQEFNEKVLRANLKIIVPTTVWVMTEGVKCLQAAGSGVADDALIDRASKLRSRALILAGARLA